LKNIAIADISLRESGQQSTAGLSFKEKLEIAKLLEKLRVDVVETGYVSESAADAAFIRALSTTLERSAISVPVQLDSAAAERAWNALSRAKKPRLDVIVPTSTVQIEYTYGLKPDVVRTRAAETVAKCAALCADVEVTAEDATRAEPEFLAAILREAIAAGAKTVTLCDSLGELFPEELAAFIERVYADVPELKTVALSIHCKDTLGLAAASAAKAATVGAAQIKTSAGAGDATLSLEQFLNVVQTRGEYLNLTVGANLTALRRTCRQLETLLGADRGTGTAFGKAVGSTESGDVQLSAETDILTLRLRVEALGYEVTDEDLTRVYARFTEVAASKAVDSRDIEALVAETAGQSPATYQLASYVINSGSAITATASLQIQKDGAELRALSMGDGPIDASFLAIEDALGRKFELEDFQIRSVTEGREAMGDALVKLRSGGKLYSGRGLSTDIVGASIRAYLSAVNKIVNEEHA
jgi:2-isopropylmalate synthase